MTRTGTAVFLLSIAAVALVGARPFAGGWNDGSRFAAVEMLAERGTFVIDESVFVRVPADPPYPYPLGVGLRDTGTRDKLLIGGHFYSDKSPVPSVVMAGLYRGWLLAGGPTARDRPDLFCYWLTVVTGGLPAVLAAWGVVVLGRVLGLGGRTHALYSVSFAAATVLPAYTRHVNAHLPFLAAAVWLVVLLARAQAAGRLSARTAVGVGTLAGVGYTLDLGVGPALVVALVPFVAVGFRSVCAVAIVGSALTPWVAAHHALNYQIAGTLVPANAVAEYLRWPGSPFDAQTATGGLKHSPAGLLLYAADLLVGKKGFLTHNLPLCLSVAGAVRLAWSRPTDRAAVGFCAGWSALAVGVYAATSTNLSGAAASVRWFVPLLAPGYWVLGLTLRAHPWLWPDLAWLTLCGVGPAVLMWAAGPWMQHLVPGWWAWAAVAGVGWAVVTARHRGGSPPRAPS